MNNFQMSPKFRRITIALNEEMYGRLLRMARQTSCGAYEMENGEVSHAIPAISAEQFATEMIEVLVTGDRVFGELLESMILAAYRARFPKESADYVVQ